jgi:hypothetical protein
MAPYTTNKIVFAVIVIIIIAAISYLLYLYSFNMAAGQMQEPDVNDQFMKLYNNITARTLLNFTLVTHEDRSITLYAFLPNETITNGLPDSMRPIASYSNSNALIGPNGVFEVLTKLANSWYVTEIKESLRNK